MPQFASDVAAVERSKRLIQSNIFEARGADLPKLLPVGGWRFEPHMNSFAGFVIHVPAAMHGDICPAFFPAAGLAHGENAICGVVSIQNGDLVRRSVPHDNPVGQSRVDLVKKHSNPERKRRLGNYSHAWHLQRRVGLDRSAVVYKKRGLKIRSFAHWLFRNRKYALHRIHKPPLRLQQIRFYHLAVCPRVTGGRRWQRISRVKGHRGNHHREREDRCASWIQR